MIKKDIGDYKDLLKKFLYYMLFMEALDVDFDCVNCADGTLIQDLKILIPKGKGIKITYQNMEYFIAAHGNMLDIKDDLHKIFLSMLGQMDKSKS